MLKVRFFWNQKKLWIFARFLKFLKVSKFYEKSEILKSQNFAEIFEKSIQICGFENLNFRAVYLVDQKNEETEIFFNLIIHALKQ